MINFTTQKEYQGTNVETLMISGFNDGSEFCTFRQALDFFKIEGTQLKGAKSCARLMKIVEKETFNKISGKKDKKKVPFYFSVFEKNHLMKIIKDNS